MNSQIVMLTKGRVLMDRQETLKNLPEFITKKIIVCCPPQELDSLKQLYLILGIKVKGVVGINHENVSELRQIVVDKLKRNIIFLDDNMNFHSRDFSNTGKDTKYLLKGINKKYFTEDLQLSIFKEMFDWIEEKLNSNLFGMVGISHRSGNNFLKYDEIYNSRTVAFWGVNYKNYLKAGSPDMSCISTKQDFFLELSFLKNGIPCVLSSNWAFDKCGGSNSSGGCSIYRTVERMNKDSKILQSLFPESVKIVEKDASKWSNLTEPTFKDVKISWKKCYTGIPVDKIVGYKQKEGRTKDNFKNKY